MYWEPIETAPTDRSILMADHFCCEVVLFDGCHFVTMDGSSFRGTHWMDLPDLPA